MSLSVYLTTQTANPTGSGIFIREGGRTKEITREEWDQKFPGREPVVMYVEESTTAWSGNITNNVSDMAAEADIYDAVWNPEACGFKFADEIIGTLEVGIRLLRDYPQRFDAFNTSDGWGTREQFIGFLEEYLQACRAFPTAVISTDH